jgi:hypothetical protein
MVLIIASEGEKVVKQVQAVKLLLFVRVSKKDVLRLAVGMG